MTIRSLTLGALAGFATLLPVAAQGPVWDPTEIARMAEQAAQFSLTFSQLTDERAVLTAAAAAAGAAGPRSLAFTPLPASVLPPSPSLPPSLAFSASATQRQQARQSVDQAQTVLWREGMALSLASDDRLAGAPAREAQLTGMVTQAADLRGDIAANSAIGLALLSEVCQVQMLLAVMLQGASFPLFRNQLGD